MKAGDIVWTIRQSIESEAYGDNTPEPPYHVKITKIDGSLVVARCFNGETGEVDHDNNATVHAQPEHFHPTEAAAWLAYRTAMYARIKDLGEQVTATLDAIHEAENRIDELNTTEVPK